MVKRKRGEGVQDELVMLSIPCLILDFRRNFLLNFHKKKRERERAKVREFFPFRLLHCGLAGEGGDYGMRV